MPGRMPALKPLDALDGKAEPVLFLLYRILRPQRYAPEAGNGEKLISRLYMSDKKNHFITSLTYAGTNRTA